MQQMKQVHPMLYECLETALCVLLRAIKTSKKKGCRFVKVIIICKWLGNMAFWSGSVNAAEAKKADGASICALLTPRPPFRIRRDA